MGGEVDGETFSAWNGLRIGHCCPACIEKFLAAPEKYLAEAGIASLDRVLLAGAFGSFINLEKKRSDQYRPEAMTLDRPRRLLHALDNPHRRYPSIHIAGTKGKGSTAAMVSVRVYNVMGQLVRTLVDGQMKEAGRHGVAWDGRNAAGALAERSRGERTGVGAGKASRAGRMSDRGA